MEELQKQVAHRVDDLEMKTELLNFNWTVAHCIDDLENYPDKTISTKWVRHRIDNLEIKYFYCPAWS